MVDYYESATASVHSRPYDPAPRARQDRDFLNVNIETRVEDALLFCCGVYAPIVCAVYSVVTLKSQEET